MNDEASTVEAASRTGALPPGRDPGGAGRASAPGRARRLPRLGFLGVGWIGCSRMQAIAECGAAEVAGLADASPAACENALGRVPGATLYRDYDEMLAQDLDGIVIATPSGGHAEQATRALERGFAVFCQKPVGRNAGEVRAVVEAAARSNRCLAVDLSYRHLAATESVTDLVRSGALGRIYAADLSFHNAYGPDKEWFYDPSRSGGGCVMDLGVHLVDLLLWVLDFPRVRAVDARLFAGGERTRSRSGPVEDYAEVTLDLDGGVAGRVSCSWNLHAGEDASVEVVFHGTDGSARIRNVGGSFYDFRAERRTGTEGSSLVEPPDDWGGRAAIRWAEALRDTGGEFDPSCRRHVETAMALDAIYESGTTGSRRILRTEAG